MSTGSCLIAFFLFWAPAAQAQGPEASDRPTLSLRDALSKRRCATAIHRFFLQYGENPETQAIDLALQEWVSDIFYALHSSERERFTQALENIRIAPLQGNSAGTYFPFDPRMKVRLKRSLENHAYGRIALVHELCHILQRINAWNSVRQFLNYTLNPVYIVPIERDAYRTQYDFVRAVYNDSDVEKLKSLWESRIPDESILSPLRALGVVVGQGSAYQIDFSYLNRLEKERTFTPDESAKIEQVLASYWDRVLYEEAHRARTLDSSRFVAESTRSDHVYMRELVLHGFLLTASWTGRITLLIHSLR